MSTRMVEIQDWKHLPKKYLYYNIIVDFRKEIEGLKPKLRTSVISREK